MIAGGVEALAARPNLGRRPLPTIEQKSDLARIVREGAPAAGFATELWTLPRLVKVIREHFGVKYYFSHVGRLLKELGFK